MKPSKETLFTRLHPLKRMLISSILSALACFIIPLSNMSTLMSIIIIWITFALSYTTLSWIILLQRTIDQIKKTATQDDGSDPFVFVMILVASFGSMFTVLLLMVSNDYGNKTLFIILSVSGMLISWVMVHTLFTFHYAHMYYNENKKASLGLDFPGEEKPDYIDFAYFAFVIGCTFQVSDVEITSKHIRRVAFIHGLLSFALNTFVVALTINLIAGARH